MCRSHFARAQDGCATVADNRLGVAIRYPGVSTPNCLAPVSGKSLGRTLLIKQLIKQIACQTFRFAACACSSGAYTWSGCQRTSVRDLVRANIHPRRSSQLSQRRLLLGKRSSKLVGSYAPRGISTLTKAINSSLQLIPRPPVSLVRCQR